MFNILSTCLKVFYNKIHFLICSLLRFYQLMIGPRHLKTCLRWFENKRCTHQPVHPHSLISAFVIHLLESIISRLTTSEISNFKLVSVAEQVVLNLAFSEPQETGFLNARPI